MTTRVPAALRAFFRIANKWQLTGADEGALLASSRRTIARWKKDGKLVKLTPDQLVRISYVFRIYAGLHAILGESPLADNWIQRRNADFADETPLARMIVGNVGDLAEVSRYVDAWQG